jgi:predicted nuclease of predicted toxin-antitoxin system
MGVEVHSEGFDVVFAVNELRGASDSQILESSFAQRRIVLTHDRDFGALVITSKQRFVGVLFLRPGHIKPSFTIESLRSLLARNPELIPPFIIVVERTRSEIHVRIRQPIP